MKILESVLNSCDQISIFVKDKNSSYLFCNESFAEAAGLDSPQQIIGKTDFDLIWREQASLYIRGDAQVLMGNILINVPEPQMQPAGLATILTTKTIMVDDLANKNGIIGYGMDITGYSFKKNNGHIDLKKKFFHLGEHFGNEYLTKREFEIFKHLLRGKSVEEIACISHRSIKTIHTQVKHIADKLGCNHKSEIVPAAIRYGLTYVLD